MLLTARQLKNASNFFFTSNRIIMRFQIILEGLLLFQIQNMAQILKY